MFKKTEQNMARTPEVDASLRNHIIAGTTIKGEIEAEGNIRIDGTVVGTIRSKGKVVVGPTGKLEGEVVCLNANISGEVKAKIAVKELLTVQATGKMLGEVATSKLVIEEGAILTGNIQMGAVVKDIGHGQQKEERQAKEGRSA